MSKSSSEKRKARKNKNLLNIRGQITAFQNDLKALGNPTDYKNPQNYTNKVNELRNKYGRGLFGQKDLADHMNALKIKESNLSEQLGNRYVQKPGFQLAELMISDQKNKPLYRKEGGIDYTLNPLYTQSEDTTSEAALAQKAALEAGALERGNPGVAGGDADYGTGGNTIIDNNKVNSAVNALSGLSSLFIKDPNADHKMTEWTTDQAVDEEARVISGNEMIQRNDSDSPSEPGDTTPKSTESSTKESAVPSRNAGHKNYDEATTATGSGALSIQKKLLDAGFTQSELNKLQASHNKKYGKRKGLLSIFKKGGN